MFDTTNGRKWVVVADWGVETVTQFYRDEQEAEAEYIRCVEAGADVFYAQTKRMMKQSDVGSKNVDWVS